ncbi:hypothetical protein [Desulfobacter latus]
MGWMNYGWALSKRHQLLSAEMKLRGDNDKSSVHTRKNKDLWPDTFGKE